MKRGQKRLCEISIATGQKTNGAALGTGIDQTRGTSLLNTIHTDQAEIVSQLDWQVKAGRPLIASYRKG
ncbi:hypothetical protein D9M69_666550 [compost metagenome]